jgi:DNA-binding transcriptional LysR family regulator
MRPMQKTCQIDAVLLSEDMHLANLHYFRAAAEEQHFGRAAQRLRISQPALSRQILNMEASLGFALFERQRRGVKLSKAGEVFLQHARQISESYERALEHARGVARGEVGRLRIGLTDFSLSYEFVAESFSRFRAMLPTINLELAVAWSSTLQRDAILEKSIDGGFIYYFENRTTPELEYSELSEEGLLLALPSSHPYARLRHVTIKHLLSEPFVWLRRDVFPERLEQLRSACRQARFTPRIVQEGPTEAALLRLVSIGMGLALVRSSLSKDLPPNVTLRPVPKLKMSLKFGFAHHRDSRSPPLTEYIRLVEALAQNDPGRRAQRIGHRNRTGKLLK